MSNGRSKVFSLGLGEEQARSITGSRKLQSRRRLEKNLSQGPSSSRLLEKEGQIYCTNVTLRNPGKQKGRERKIYASSLWKG